MSWIQTYSGKKIDPLNPRPQDIAIDDIAHALSLKCRFTGHCNFFYSAAQHSVLVSQNCQHMRWGLLHNAAEAYLPDVSSPIKSRLGDFQDVENNLLLVIASVFGLEIPIPEDVFQADIVLLATEQRDLMNDFGYVWPQTANHSPLNNMIYPWSPEYTKQMFYRRFKNLFYS